jgi:hypothetical protein
MSSVILLNSSRAEAEVLAEGVASQRAAEEGLQGLLPQAADLVAHCRDYPAKVRGHWESFQKTGETQVLILVDVAPYMESLLRLTDAFLATVEAVRAGLAEAAELPAAFITGTRNSWPAPDFKVLTAATDELVPLRAEIAEWWNWFNAPVTFDGPRRTTSEIRAAIERGEYISVEDAMIEAGLDPNEAL